MLLIRSFIFCGLICLISQIVLDNTKLTPGHITSILVVIGVLLDFSNVSTLHKLLELTERTKKNANKNTPLLFF